MLKWFESITAELQYIDAPTILFIRQNNLVPCIPIYDDQSFPKEI